MKSGLLLSLTLLFCSVISLPTYGRVYDMYRADYAKGAFCSVIAGACAADPTLSNAFFQNPAALTVQKKADWDFDADYTGSANLEPGMKGSNAVSETSFSGGVASNFGKWGAGISFSGYLNSVSSQVSVVDQANVTRALNVNTHANLFEFNVPFARALNEKTSLGASLYGTLYSQTLTIAGSNSPLSDGSGLAVGFSLGLMHQFDSKLGFGSWFKGPATNYTTVDISNSKSGTTLNYSENLALHYPWIFANGVSYKPWDDDRTFYFDLDLIGPTYGGNQLTFDTFSSSLDDSAVRAKGRYLVVEPRVGYRMPWPNNPLGTLHYGTYYEPSRWEGLPSRIHLTGGISYVARTWLELLSGIDVANSFFQIFITFR